MLPRVQEYDSDCELTRPSGQGLRNWIKALAKYDSIKYAMCVNGGSGILFGFSPKRYSGRRVKTPQLLLIKLFINETNLFKVLLSNENAN